MKIALLAAKCIVISIFILATCRMILHDGTSVKYDKYIAIVSVLVALIITEIERWYKSRK